MAARSDTEAFRVALWAALERYLVNAGLDPSTWSTAGRRRWPSLLTVNLVLAYCGVPAAELAAEVDRQMTNRTFKVGGIAT